MPFNDFSAFYELTKKDSLKYRRYGVSAGYMIAFKWWNHDPDGSTDKIEVDDDKFPIGAYNGPQLRLYYETVRSEGGKLKFRGPEILFKYLYYDDELFIDFFSHDDAKPVFYRRSEKTFVIGAEWLWGKDINDGKLFHQVFWGIGGRIKFRDINTLSHYSEPPGYEGNIPLGQKHTILVVPTLNFGIKLGACIKNKKAMQDLFNEGEKTSKAIPSILSYNDTLDELQKTDTSFLSNLSNDELFAKGQLDASRYYRGYKAAGTGTLIISLFSPIAGLIPAIACSSSKPIRENLQYPNVEIMKNTNYYNGYINKAKKIKKRKVLTNWEIGLGVNLITLLIISSNHY
ncbi:MAG: hypothetical protein ABIS37_10770 [Bacteroidia bacterium]